MVAGLVVGQDVCLDAGVYSLDGKVVNITREGVYVQTYGEKSDGSDMGKPSHLLRFNKDGELVWDEPWYLRPIPAEGGTCYLTPKAMPVPD